MEIERRGTKLPSRGRPAKFPAVKQQIRNAILEGRYQPEQKLPSFPHVAAALGVGDLTAKRAIDELVEEGWLVTRRGVGTFVNARASIAPIVLTLPARNNPFSYLLSTAELDEFHEQNPGVRVIYSGEKTTDLVATDTYGMIVDCARGRTLRSLDQLRREFGLPPWELPAVARRTAEWRDKQYGLPLHLDLRVFQYNPRVFQKYGVKPPGRYLDWDGYAEVLETCRSDDDGDGVIECHGSFCYLQSDQWLVPFWQQGGRLDDEVAFFREDAVRAIDRLWQLVHVQRWLPLEMPIAQGEMYMKQVRRRFYDGKLALRWIGVRELFHPSPFVSEAALCRFGPLDRQFLDGILLGIHRDCAYPEVAMKFLDFCYRRFVRDNADYPFALSEAERDTLARRPDLRDLLLEGLQAGTNLLEEGVPERTWEIENEIFQWFRLFQDRPTTMSRMREAWKRFRGQPDRQEENREFVPDGGETLLAANRIV